MRYRHLLLAGAMVSAIAVPQVASAFDGTSGTGEIVIAQREDPKKKKKEAPKARPRVAPQQKAKPQQRTAPQQKAQPQPRTAPKQKAQPQQRTAPQQKARPEPKTAPQRRTVEPQPKTAPRRKAVEPSKKTTPQQKVQPQPKTVQPQQRTAPKAEPKTVQPQQKVAPKAEPKTVQPQRKVAPKADPKSDPKTVQPRPGVTPKQDPKTVRPQPGVAPKQDPKAGQRKAVEPQRKRGPDQPDKKDAQRSRPKFEPQTFGKPKETPGSRIGNVKEIKGKRQEKREGNRVVIREPGNRTIIRENNRIIIHHDESARMRRWGNARVETRGRDRYTTVRRGNYDIVTITDHNGRLLRRYRRGSDGREYVFIDNRRRGIGPGAIVAGAVLLGLAAPVITIPRERYIVDVGHAPPALLYETLEAPPVVPLERAYTLDEVRYNVELRDRVRSVDINTINFSSGSWEVSPDQAPQLQALADAMLKVISENPTSVFMLEGHTDAVGIPEDNLSLSDRRAESVAEILTANFNVPPENLVTQGYGEQHLRVRTDGPSRENRRVQVRNITDLMAGGGNAPAGPPPG